MIVECAPLAGFTNADFRAVLVSLGAKTVYTEMISATAIFYKSKKTINMLGITKNAKNVVQLFGYKPEHFEHAIKCGVLDGFDEININMGCPANKIVKNNEGVALMGNPNLAQKIVETCAKASTVPITVKMRLGIKSPQKEQSAQGGRGGERPAYVEFARLLEKSGAKRLIVHGRYGEQGYSGVADWNAIAEIVRAVNIPVIANGDIKNLDDARRCLEITGASGVMVGRALLPIYKKYFPQKPQIIRGEKISNSCGIDHRIDNIIGLFHAGE